MKNLGGVRADYVRAKNLSVLRVADNLHKPFGLAGGACASARRKWKLADLELELLLLALLLSETDGRDFGMAVGRVGDVGIVHHLHVRITGEQLCQHDAFALSLVRQHRRTCDVTN